MQTISHYKSISLPHETSLPHSQNTIHTSSTQIKVFYPNCSCELICNFFYLNLICNLQPGRLRMEPENTLLEEETPSFSGSILIYGGVIWTNTPTLIGKMHILHLLNQLRWVNCGSRSGNANKKSMTPKNKYKLSSNYIVSLTVRLGHEIASQYTQWWET